MKLEKERKIELLKIAYEKGLSRKLISAYCEMSPTKVDEHLNEYMPYAIKTMRFTQAGTKIQQLADKFLRKKLDLKFQVISKELKICQDMAMRVRAYILAEREFYSYK